MSHPKYSMFSKRNYNKRSVYNFEKRKDYTLAEKWFKERKEIRQELTTATVISTTVPIQIKSTKQLLPGLIRQEQDSCDIDFNIPSYDDFIYPDAITLTHLIESNNKNYQIDSDIYF